MSYEITGFERQKQLGALELICSGEHTEHLRLKYRSTSTHSPRCEKIEISARIQVGENASYKPCDLLSKSPIKAYQKAFARVFLKKALDTIYKQFCVTQDVLIVFKTVNELLVVIERHQIKASASYPYEADNIRQ